MLGQNFLTGLTQARVAQAAALYIQANKLLCFKERGKHRSTDPVREYAQERGVLHPVKIKTFDTILPFGKGSLTGHAQTFLGVAKAEAITRRDKAHMLETFRAKTKDAYLYAAWDAVLALLVEERMREAEITMYTTLGFPPNETPPLRCTQGTRVAEMILKSAVRASAAGSVLLSQKGKPLKDGRVGKASASKVKAAALPGCRCHSSPPATPGSGSRPGETHGGLLYSRSPTSSSTQRREFRDVDLTGCYASIIGSLNLYVGRPVVHEPGTWHEAQGRDPLLTRARRGP